MDLISSLPNSNAFQGSYFTEEKLKRLESNFIRASNDGFINLEQFQKVISSKNKFFIKRIFKICDQHDSGMISIDQFMTLVRSLIGKPAVEKLKFIFKVYDIDGDGTISFDEMCLVIKSCMEENGLWFSEDEINDLADIIFEEAQDETQSYGKTKSLNFIQLKKHLTKYPGLIENLSINVERWLLPAIEISKKQSMKMPNKLRWSHIRNNYVDVIFILMFLMINIGLLTQRAYYYYKLNSNVFYIAARASGQCLNFTSTFLILTMLRRSITFLRSKGFSSILPLDHHIYYHKMTGWFVFVYSLVHSLMHIANFSVNWKLLNEVSFSNFTLTEYLFDPRATSHLGLIKGYACITGWLLLIILLIMIPLAQPCVRRSGKFEIFYFTHLLYLPWYVSLIIHAPNFWKWFLVPGIIFIIESLRGMILFSPSGQTYAEEGILLPSRVIHLAIKKPENFHFQPGDYVFVNIPLISRFEWHPFTISSAPEQKDVIWLHIRGVGEWTNALIDYFLVHELIQCALNENDKQYCTPSQPLHRKSLLQSELFKRSMIKSTKYMTKRKQEKNEEKLSNILLNVPSFEAENGNAKRTLMNRRSTVLLFEKKIIHAPTYENLNKLVNNEMNWDEEAQVELRSKKKGKIQQRKRMTQIINKNDRVINTGISLVIRLDGPYGSPSNAIFDTKHAVLVATGIGVTPFASILQSIMQRYLKSRYTCPKCNHRWSISQVNSIYGMKLRKVDFVWINRDQRSFEWFVNLLSQLELQQAELSESERILNIHMYVSSAANKSDIKTLGLQLALDLMHEKNQRDFITGLKSRTKPGRPNWDQFFSNIKMKNRGEEVTIFFCGAPELARLLRSKCNEFKFKFRKEVF